MVDLRYLKKILKYFVFEYLSLVMECRRREVIGVQPFYTTLAQLTHNEVEFIHVGPTSL
jgi:hypothetical protein